MSMRVTPISSRAFCTSSPTSRPLPCCSACLPSPLLSTSNHCFVMEILQGPSILFRPQDASAGAVGLGDDPQPDALEGRVRGQEPAAVHEGLVVQAPVLVIDLPPIAP